MDRKKPNIFKRYFIVPVLGKIKTGTHDDIRTIISRFSFRETAFFWLLVWVFIISTILLLIQFNNTFLLQRPVSGGELEEGIVGSPRFVNPVLARSDADRDLTQLVYSGLLRAGGQQHFTNDLAQGYDISEDGLTYTFTLKDDIFFHDGERVTTSDIVFTINAIRDPLIKSPRRASWEGVQVEAISSKQIEFVLPQPYAPFLENTTIGILPEHVWSEISVEDFSFSTYNTSPVGSGPYTIKKIKRDRETGIPVYYDLVSFDKFTLGEPFIEKIRLYFFPNENKLKDAYQRGEVESIGGLQSSDVEELKNSESTLTTFNLTRIFALFFNQNQAQLFTRKSVREALSLSVKKEELINAVLNGFGSEINGPVFGLSEIKSARDPDFIELEEIEETGEEDDSDSEKSESAEVVSINVFEKKENGFDKAINALKDDGWSFNEEAQVLVRKSEPLSFSIATANIPELKKAAELLKTQWERLGARIDIQVFELSDLNQNVIRPRDFDALLFGEVVGRDPDPFAFWHSSQRLDPGLNIAQYASITADKLLEEARVILDPSERMQKYAEFQQEIDTDIPAVFLYAPDYIYIQPLKIKGVRSVPITIASERFLNVHEWYIYTSRIWNFSSQTN